MIAAILRSGRAEASMAAETASPPPPAAIAIAERIDDYLFRGPIVASGLW